MAAYAGVTPQRSHWRPGDHIDVPVITSCTVHNLANEMYTPPWSNSCLVPGVLHSIATSENWTFKILINALWTPNIFQMGVKIEGIHYFANDQYNLLVLPDMSALRTGAWPGSRVKTISLCSVIKLNKIFRFMVLDILIGSLWSTLAKWDLIWTILQILQKAPSEESRKFQSSAITPTPTELNWG